MLPATALLTLLALASPVGAGHAQAAPARAGHSPDLSPDLREVPVTVRDARSGRPVPFAAVLLAGVAEAARRSETARAPGAPARVRTDLAGRYALALEPGSRYLVTARGCEAGPVSRPALVTDSTPAAGVELRVETSPCDPPRPEREYRGHFTHGFEELSFVPCGSSPETGDWWVEFADPALARGWPQGEPAPNASRHFVRWRGVLSGADPMGFGQFGMSRRQLVVTRVLEARAPRPADCGPAVGPPAADPSAASAPPTPE